MIRHVSDFNGLNPPEADSTGQPEGVLDNLEDLFGLISEDRQRRDGAYFFRCSTPRVPIMDTQLN
jgi:hypothetical protein